MHAAQSRQKSPVEAAVGTIGKRNGKTKQFRCLQATAITISLSSGPHERRQRRTFQPGTFPSRLAASNKNFHLTCKHKLTHNHTVKSKTALRSRTRLRGSDVFAAVGDPTRRKVLDMLSRQNLAAGQIALHFRISRPAISQHLHVLRHAKLVTVSRKGREHIYHLNPEPLRQVYDWIEHYKQFWNAKLAALGQYLDQISGGKG
jgi:DNA-binding transcriptional ArsR family regulator